MNFWTDIKDTLLALGIPGVFLIALLDSAAVPLPGGPDAVVMLLSWRYPAEFPLIALAAAVGSTIGCLFIYQVGRKSGQLALARFKPERREWVKEKLDRNGVLTMMVAVMAPPPFPTKLFILGAGVVKMGVSRFTVGVLMGRLVRFFAEGYLGLQLGEKAAEVLQKDYPRFALILILALILFLIIRRVWQRSHPGRRLETTIHKR